MAERRAQQKYYPPDYNPARDGSLNAMAGQHPLRARARRLQSDGILVVRMETPLGLWCGGCEALIARGTRVNAEKSRAGTYLALPVWRLRFSCVHCRAQALELETDPQNAGYRVVSGGRAQALPDPPADAPAAARTSNPFSQAAISGDADRLGRLQNLQQRDFADPFTANQRLRSRARPLREAAEASRRSSRALRRRLGIAVTPGPETPEIRAAAAAAFARAPAVAAAESGIFDGSRQYRGKSRPRRSNRRM